MAFFLHSLHTLLVKEVVFPPLKPVPFISLPGEIRALFDGEASQADAFVISDDRAAEASVRIAPTGDTVIYLHPRASVRIYLTIGSSSRINVVLADEARCDLVCLLDASSESIHVDQESVIASGASMQWRNITLGGGIEQRLVSRVTGANGVSNIDWIFTAHGQERQELAVTNVFEAADGGGEIVMKGVAEGKAHVAAKGKIEIGPHGGGTNTYLTQNVLMLDASSKVDAVPALEIKTNDVKASHSATVSRVTPEDLFYFASRGIEAAEARAMYVQGFLGELLGKIEDAVLREELSELLMRALAIT